MLKLHRTAQFQSYGQMMICTIYWWISQRNGGLAHLSSMTKSLTKIWISQGTAAGLKAAMVSCAALGCVQSTLCWRVRLRSWSDVSYCHFERQTQQSRAIWNVLPLQQQSKSRNPLSLLLYQLWNEKLQGIIEHLLEEKSKSSNMCEFKRDERNN